MYEQFCQWILDFREGKHDVDELKQFYDEVNDAIVGTCINSLNGQLKSTQEHGHE